MAQTAVQIPCCLCGTPILPNAANQCNACLAQQFDLKELLYKSSGSHDGLTINQCRQCRKFARTDTVYEYADPESPQLLAICLKHIPALVHPKTASAASKLHIVDAMWVWTEPHSMRLKVRVTLRTEVENVPLQQRIMVEFQIRWKQCPDCNREYTSRTWHAIVQLRQKRETGSPRKGMAALEMALQRNADIRKHVLKIDSSRHGMDFYFLSLPQAQAFGQFLSKLAPMRIKTSQKLVSTDNHNNTANLKHTLTADMVPLCRDDLILVGKASRTSLAGRLGLVLKVSSQIQVVDASPKRTTQMDTMDVSPEAYYKAGGDKSFTILQTADRMIRWVVLDVEPCDPNDDATRVYEGPASGVSKYSMANVLVARESDMGKNDSTYSCVTHLGHLIQSGDVVLGYDMESTSTSVLSTSSSMGVVDLEEVLHSNVVLPDVILVKKVSGNAATTADVDDSKPEEEETVMHGKKRVSKRKLRKRKQKDKKQRELEESAVRMGFFEDFKEESSPHGEDMGGEDGATEAMQELNLDDPSAKNQLEARLADDPDLAEDLEAVERALADTYQDKTAEGTNEELPVGEQSGNPGPKEQGEATSPSGA